MLAAAALVAGSLAMSAQVAPARAAAQPAVNPDHITVLAAALKKMHDNYASFANFTPGPQDIFDYNIGNLWLKGIDGSGTTVAVIEDPQTGQVLVRGFTAAPGFDVASGWGTVDASTFGPALVAATRASGLTRSARNEAGRELSGLQHAIRLSPGSGGTTSVSSTGFLPRHPVKLAIDGTVVTTLTADDNGVVSYPLDPAALGLMPGHHVLTLQGMLITTTASFRS